MLHTMRRLARLGEPELGGVIEDLQEIRTRLFRRSSLRIVVTCEESMIPALEELLTGLVGELNDDGQDGRPFTMPAIERAPEARTGPVPVAFNVRVFRTVRYTHQDSAPRPPLAH